MTGLITSWVATWPGFIVGMVAGWLIRDRWEHMTKTTKLLTNRGAQILILSLIATITVVGIVALRAGDQRIIDCVQRYNTAQAEAQKPRTDALERRDRALSTVVAAAALVLDDTDDAAAQRRLHSSLVQFQRLDVELMQARADHPYPDPPKTLCEEGTR